MSVVGQIWQQTVLFVMVPHELCDFCCMTAKRVYVFFQRGNDAFLVGNRAVLTQLAFALNSGDFHLESDKAFHF